MTYAIVCLSIAVTGVAVLCWDTFSTMRNELRMVHRTIAMLIDDRLEKINRRQKIVDRMKSSGLDLDTAWEEFFAKVQQPRGN